jgi:hypothetical protein
MPRSQGHQSAGADGGRHQRPWTPKEPPLEGHDVFRYNIDMSTSATASVLDRILDPFVECLTPEVALRVVNLRADVEMQTRLEELADKANEGQLSPDDQAEYDRFREAFHFATILQAKARTFLQRNSAP